ncbi:MAG: cyclic nucleotide-binding domain-containing protein [Coriobacteriia bacterium]
MKEPAIDIAAFLETVPLFGGLPEEDRQRLASVMERHHYHGSETIFSEGETGDTMHIIVFGKVHVLRSDHDGGEVALGTLGPRQYFGEMALFENVSRSAKVKVHPKSAYVLTLSRAHLLGLIRENADLALHLIAGQNRRLREVNDRVVEVDREARRYAPTLGEIVAKDYPHPIALVFKEMETVADSEDKLRRMLELAETILLYMSAIAKSSYLRGPTSNTRVDEEILNGRNSCTLGYSHRLIRLVVDHLQGAKPKGIGGELCSWYGRRVGAKKPIPRLLDELTELRNLLKHGSEAALDEHACARFLEEHEPKIHELLASLQFLRNHPLIHIQGMQFSEGAFQYAHQVCMGAFRSFHTGAFTHDQPWDTQRLYVFDRETSTPLPMFPWLGLYRCETCGDRDIFLTTVWSPKRLTTIEFGRGHRHSPADVGASVASMVELLEQRIAQGGDK